MLKEGAPNNFCSRGRCYRTNSVEEILSESSIYNLPSSPSPSPLSLSLPLLSLPLPPLPFLHFLSFSFLTNSRTYLFHAYPPTHLPTYMLLCLPTYLPKPCIHARRSLANISVFFYSLPMGFHSPPMFTRVRGPALPALVTSSGCRWLNRLWKCPVPPTGAHPSVV